MAKKTKATTDKRGNELHLIVTEERDNGYFHLRARVTTQKFEDHNWVPYGVDDDYSDGLLWSGLRINCQGDDRSRERSGEGDGGAVYGFDVDYRDVYSVDLRKARRMAKTLDKLDKGLAKMTEARGYVRSYGEYIGRVAEVIGAAGIGFDRQNKLPRNGQRFDWMSIGDGVNRANHLIYLWQQDGKPEAVTGQ